VDDLIRIKARVFKGSLFRLTFHDSRLSQSPISYPVTIHRIEYKIQVAGNKTQYVSRVSSTLLLSSDRQQDTLNSKAQSGAPKGRNVQPVEAERKKVTEDA
jgi:hypothetical protein